MTTALPEMIAPRANPTIPATIPDFYLRNRWARRATGQHSAGFGLYLEALDTRHGATGQEMFLSMDNGPRHTSDTSRAALAGWAAWLHVIWLAKYSPELERKEREWRVLKRAAQGDLAPRLRAFIDGS